MTAILSPDADPTQRADPGRGRRYALAAAVMWSVGGAAAKGIALDGASIAFYRGLFAGLALLPFVPRRHWKLSPALLLLAIIFGGMTGCYLGAIKATTAANAIFLQCTSTFWTIPMSFLLLGERPDRRSVVGIMVGMVGVAAIVAGSRSGDSRGIALGLASGVLYGAVGVIFRYLRGLDPGWLSAASNLGGAASLAAWIFGSGGSIAVPTAGQASALVAFGVVQMAIPYLLFARALREIGAPEAGLIGLVEPALNPVWVLLTTGERPGGATVFGGLMLLAGVAVRYVGGGRREEIS